MITWIRFYDRAVSFVLKLAVDGGPIRNPSTVEVDQFSRFRGLHVENTAPFWNGATVSFATASGIRTFCFI